MFYAFQISRKWLPTFEKRILVPIQAKVSSQCPEFFEECTGPFFLLGWFPEVQYGVRFSGEGDSRCCHRESATHQTRGQVSGSEAGGPCRQGGPPGYLSWHLSEGSNGDTRNFPGRAEKGGKDLKQEPVCWAGERARSGYGGSGGNRCKADGGEWVSRGPIPDFSLLSNQSPFYITNVFKWPFHSLVIQSSDNTTFTHNFLKINTIA